jgi:hypothetical protein
MYPRPKKDLRGWLVTIFVGATILLLVGTLFFCFLMTRNDVNGFTNLKGNDDGFLSLKRD